ncbi:MAG: ECF transporter S component [Clostridia bacterium]|nr:ECF transporter S component [Clostridia bacterium]
MKSRRTDIKRLTMAAMLCALAYLVMVLIKIPVVLFLSYEPKDVIIALGGFIWGPSMALWVSVAVSFVEMVTVSSTGYIGLIMNILSTCSFACTAALIYKKKRTLSGALIGLFVGSILMTALMLGWNYLITPMYMNIPREAVAALLLPAFLPFNLIKAMLNSVFTFLLYGPVINALRNTGFIDKSKEQSSASRKPKYLLIAACALVTVACVLGILLLNGTI